MKLMIVLTIFIACLFLVGPIMIIPVLFYLAAGMIIYFLGTRPAPPKNKSIRRHCKQKHVFKNESIDVSIDASACQVPPVTEPGNPWNIVLVIDKSNSMMGSPLANAKIAAKTLIASTPNDFWYGIVEFQHHAHIRSQLTQNITKLKFMINRIFSGGGTAIDQGLLLAQQVLKHELKPGVQNAVILLSDGGSAHGPALKEAEELKEQGVVIYSIGLGVCDTELMQQVASDNEKYFYAHDSSQLKGLFYSIGRIIQNVPAREIEITEFPNVKKTPLRISGWGDIQPSTFDFGDPGSGQKMTAQWYLPTLKTEYISLDYKMTSRCYGWFRVSEESAQLTLKDAAENQHNFKSNKGPYVLVIPRFFLWQIFWVFLNPLFWILFRKLGCKEEPTVAIGDYEPPKRVPVPQPELLPTLQTRFKLSVTPTLALGIGYGGINAVTHLKRLLWEHNEDKEVAQKVSCATMDTVNPWFADNTKSGHVSMGFDEKINIHAPVNRLIRQQADMEQPEDSYIWLQPRQKRAESIDHDTGFGTNLHRTVGRLMFLNNRDKLNTGTGYDQDETNLKSLIEGISQRNLGKPFQICIAGTLCGGTSSGVILDLCYTIRKVLEQLNIDGVGITLFLMDEEADTSDPQRDTKTTVMRANRDGFVNELARFFAARDIDSSPLPGDIGIKRWFDRIICVNKKQDTANLTDLYPQCAMLMYSFAVEKKFRGLLQKNTQYIHDALLVHKFETDTTFFFKRTLENYYSVRLLLTAIGDHFLGLAENPADYTENSVDHNKIKKYVDDAFELLYANPGWKNALPILLKPANMIRDPKPHNVSSFLSHAGMMAVIESASQGRVDEFLNKETETFKNLLHSWLECLLATHKDPKIIIPREKKFPAAHFTLLSLKENLDTIRNIVESAPETADFLLRKRCQAVAEMCSRFKTVIDNWLSNLGKWWTVLGDGNEYITGTCRSLNAILNDLEKSLQSTRAYTTPYFAYNEKIENCIYQKYFAKLEHKILEQLHWQVEDETGRISLLIVDNENVNSYPPELTKSSVSDGIFETLLKLPAYFASEQNKWHEASVLEIMELTKEGDRDIMEEYFIPQVFRNSQPNILYLEPTIAGVLQNQVSAGLTSETFEAGNPLLTGFYKYRFNHEAVSTRSKFHPQRLPSYVFSEEWNCYNALTVYSNLVDEEPLTPPYTLIALCRNMKRFLGLIYSGILEQGIEEMRGENRMVYRFHTLEAPVGENEDVAFLNLLRYVIETENGNIEDLLLSGYREILKLNPQAIMQRLEKFQLNISQTLEEQLYQLSVGGVEYYRNLK